MIKSIYIFFNSISKLKNTLIFGYLWFLSLRNKLSQSMRLTRVSDVNMLKPTLLALKVINIINFKFYDLSFTYDHVQFCSL